MLEQFTTWLLSLVAQFLQDLWQFVVDAFVNALEMVLNAVVALFALIPVPAFLSGGLQSVFSGLDPAIAFLVAQFGVLQGFAILGTAYLFRLGRKVVTLFQW